MVKKTDIELSFVFPTFDEDQNIFNRIQEINALQILLNKSVEIVISDDTPNNELLEKRISKLGNKNLNIKYISRHKKKLKKGLAASILDGITSSSGNFICVADVDGQHNIFDAFFLYKKAKENSLIAIGSRFKRGGGMGSASHYCVALLFNLWLSIINSVPCLDKTGGFFVFNSFFKNEFLLKYKSLIFNGYGDYFISLTRLIYVNKIKFKEYPVFYRLRSSGYSKSNFPKMIITYSYTCIKSRFLIKKNLK